jgi:hypothetical protein
VDVSIARGKIACHPTLGLAGFRRAGQFDVHLLVGILVGG